MTHDDRYGDDPIAAFGVTRRAPVRRRRVSLQRGLVLEHAVTEFLGEVIGAPAAGILELRDFDGFTRSFPLSDSFLLDGEPIELVRTVIPAAPKTTASGSLRGPQSRAKVARASRIFVEGRHDAELIEKVWGDDLREHAIVVEILDGVDNLEQVLADFSPGPSRRAGILVDHLVDRSKESRIAAEIESRFRSGVLILGHPFVDVWQAVKPSRVGITAWPQPPRTVEWKRGVCLSLGWPCEEQRDIAEAWRFILSRVSSYRDLEPQLSGQVEHLIDFVTVGHH